MFDSLSDTQKEIVFDKSGKFVVRACPGSGKTYCVAARLAKLLDKWPHEYAGIATLSFTNVAWKEIEKKCSQHFGTQKIGFPHFLGTIDSFINKFIFLPYGHLILKCPNRPILVGEPHGIWTGKFFSQSLFDKISYNVDGGIYALNPRAMPRNWGENKEIVKAKYNLNKAGYATQADANYFSMKLLENFPQIGKALALRFPYLIIDEAQDTSDIQMRIIDNLIGNGLNQVMLVGDPDQAIFEWNDARPDLLIQKFNEWPNSVLVNENRRSSQLICNATYPVSSLVIASTAVTEAVKDFAFKPKVITYQNNLPEIVNSFITECANNGIEVSQESTAIIYRSKNVFNEITGIPEIEDNKSPWQTHDNYTKDFAKGKFLYDQGDLTGGFKTIERALVKFVKKLPSYSEDALKELVKKHDYIAFKTNVWKFIKLLPSTDISIGDWVDNGNALLRQKNVPLELSVTNAGKNLSFKQIFVKESDEITDRNYRLGTVHNVKGESFDATLLVLKTRGVGKAYKTILNENIPIADSEELRIAYVGLTRPRKILMVAVPNEENKTAWENKLFTEFVE